ncbi:MAG: GAF domain-containing protein [Limisphaera sp.]|nr:GAF domain-containing protein [Limisphaera sp.]
MFEMPRLSARSKPARYRALAEALRSLLAGERDFLANAANTAALLYHGLPRLNWVGLYRWLDGGLVLGPFQGKPACTRIRPGQGVCGTAVARRATIVVPDVTAFPGHIACDPASRSEIVIPLIVGDRLLGVWDMDSPEPGRFDAEDQAGLECLLEILLANSAWEGAPVPQGRSRARARRTDRDRVER